MPSCTRFNSAPQIMCKHETYLTNNLIQGSVADKELLQTIRDTVQAGSKDHEQVALDLVLASCVNRSVDFEVADNQ